MRGHCASNLGTDHRTLEVHGRHHLPIYHAGVPDGTRRPAERHFCQHRGTAMWLHAPRRPDLVHPHAGAVDTSLPVPLKARTPWGLQARLGRGALRPQDTSAQERPETSLAGWHRQHGLASRAARHNRPMSLAPPTSSPPAARAALVPAAIDFSAPAHAVARRLIGMTLLVDGVGGRIVETEAYDQADPASHTYGGPTARNAAMFGPPGHAYVYRSYGLHWCVNTVCREAGHGAGVLLRALEPTHGLEAMRARRGLQDARLLCAGPGRLAQALDIDARLDGEPLDRPPFQLLEPASSCAASAAAAPATVAVACGPRIGISKAVEVPWRFGEAGSRYLSRPFTAARPRAG